MPAVTHSTWPTAEPGPARAVQPDLAVNPQNTKIMMANYLTMVSDRNLRKTLTKYRLSEHSLAIERVDTGKPGSL